MVVIVMIAFVMPAGSVMGDTFIKQTNHTDAVEIMGRKQAAVDDTMSIWLKDGKSCMQSTDGKTYIFDPRTAELYMVDPTAETYSVIPMDMTAIFDEAVEGADEENKAEVDAARKMMESMVQSIKVTVTPTDETKTIKDWNTTKYVMNMTMAMGNTTTEMWVTEDIKIDMDIYKAVANSRMAAMPGYQKILAETRKIKGIPVLSVSQTAVMGSTIKTTVEILEVTEKEAPSGIFDIPSNYKEVDMMQVGQ